MESKGHCAEPLVVNLNQVMGVVVVEYCEQITDAPVLVDVAKLRNTPSSVRS
jgi:hypothetical protein